MRRHHDRVQRRTDVPVRQEDHRLHRRQLRDQFAHGLASIEVPAAVPIPVHGKEQPGLDLSETVEHAGGAHVGRATRPDGADAGGRQQRRDRLGDVRHVGCDPVAAADPEPLERCAQRARRGRQFTPADDAARNDLRLEHEGRPLGPAGLERPPQHVVGVVQGRAREPLRTGHASLAQHLVVGPGRADAAVVPDRGPEGLDLVDRPLPQRLVVGELQAALARQPFAITGQPGTRHALGRRGPQGSGIGHRGRVGR